MSTEEVIFIVRQVQEKYLEGNRKVYTCFVDLEKAYDRVPRSVVYWCLRKRGVPEKLTEEELQERFLAWKGTLERRGLKVNTGKTELMISSREGHEEVNIGVEDGTVLKQNIEFNYLGSIIIEEGGTVKTVRQRQKEAWQNWREVIGVVLDNKMPLRLKMKIYKTVIRSTLLYGTETWALKRNEEGLLERSEMIRETENFEEVCVGLHQGSALTPYLLVLVLDVLSEETKNVELRELLYADGLVNTAENEEDLQRRVGEWQESLERGGMAEQEVSEEVVKTSSSFPIIFTFRSPLSSPRRPASRHNNTILAAKSFFVEDASLKIRPLGSTLSHEGGNEAEVDSRIKAVWGKWREVAGVVCDKKMSIKLKVKIYSTVIRPVLLYGSETWALRRKEKAKLEETAMRILRWIMRISLLERLENDEIRRAGLVKITEMIRKARLRWYGHVLRMDDEEGVKRAWEEPVRGRISRGRQRIRWRDKVKEDMDRRGRLESIRSLLDIAVGKHFVIARIAVGKHSVTLPSNSGLESMLDISVSSNRVGKHSSLASNSIGKAISVSCQ
ncbi:uncharacterized protein LOC135224796 [Macrobrachium nipponense]|uniref:uncharacterized protein LOC135224796 n=1 Tax=Macrobrachium nipponense TaxID=159736 RepID=UPI0030C7A2F7